MQASRRHPAPGVRAGAPAPLAAPRPRPGTGTEAASPALPEPADRILGRRLRRVRIARGLTQRQVAAALGLSYKQIQNYEAGRSRIVVTTLVSFARVFRTSVSALLRDLAEDDGAATEGDELLLISDAELAHLSRLRTMPRELTLPIFRLTEILAHDEGGQGRRRRAAASGRLPAEAAARLPAEG